MKWKWPGIIAGVCVGLAIGYFVLSNQEETERVVSEPVVVSQPVVMSQPVVVNGTAELKWEHLLTLDYKTGTAPDELKMYDGKRVKIGGFVVPLSDDFSMLDEFLLVPDAQSCIHIPPPPPNLIVQSTLETPLSIDDVFNPAWITGILKIEQTESQYGSAGFKMVVEKMEEYVY